MRANDLEKITKTVATVRAELHPELAADFLDAVIRAEDENAEDDEGALRMIQAALTKVLASGGPV
jgi:ABC-type nitrate/sulfonate/bicarbonate transport system substrate-binding protein